MCKIGSFRVSGFLFIAAAAALLFTAEPSNAQSRRVRIMPLGDSLTSSVDGQASYRFWLWRQLAGRYPVDFVGSLWGVGDGSSGIYSNFDQDHEGHSGATTDDVLDGISGWASEFRPDIVLLLIGGNDLEQGQSAAHAVANTRRIIATLRAANPNVSILWATIPPSSRPLNQLNKYNGAVFHYAPAWSTSKSPIRVVNLTSNFNPSTDTVDGEHPNANGEKKFASRFYNQITSVIRRY